MAELRIQLVEALEPFWLRLTLTDGEVVERDVQPLLRGPLFDPLIQDPARFAEARAEYGTVVWPNGADLCPDMLIWGGAPPRGEGTGR